jgi:murein DD-endopeptidase MepM/ murein hydrolase activator NlpD
MLYHHPLFLRLMICGSIACTLTSCVEQDPFTSSNTLRQIGPATSDRPQPDQNGVISYETYQVVVAKRGETLNKIAKRLGLDPIALARKNGIRPEDSLRNEEVIVLPKNVRIGSGDITSTPLDQTGTVDIAQLAQTAIDGAAPQKFQRPVGIKTVKVSQTGTDPIRHKVERGETAFTISRLYDVSVRSLADWNGLDQEFSVREGQYLLIPVGIIQREKTAVVSKPGQGSITPVPPSSTKAMPAPAAVTAPIEAIMPPLSLQQTKPALATARMVYPINGKVIREYVKGKNDGIDMSGSAGGDIVAAANGIVAAITADADQVPIMVIKHPDNVLTVYANANNIIVKKGDSVSRGQKIAELPQKAPISLHFEVRKGFNSVDPMEYLR